MRVRTGSLTHDNVGDRKLAVNLYGLIGLLKAGAVLHIGFDGAAFVISTDTDAARAVAAGFQATHPTFVIDVYDQMLERLTSGSIVEHEAAVVRDLDGVPVAGMKVWNTNHRPLTGSQEKALVQPALAESLTAGAVFFDGTFIGGSPLLTLATAKTATQYQPGRVVLRVVKADGTPMTRSDFKKPTMPGTADIRG